MYRTVNVSGRGKVTPVVGSQRPPIASRPSEASAFLFWLEQFGRIWSGERLHTTL